MDGCGASSSDDDESEVAALLSDARSDCAACPQRGDWWWQLSRRRAALDGASIDAEAAQLAASVAPTELVHACATFLLLLSAGAHASASLRPAHLYEAVERLPYTRLFVAHVTAAGARMLAQWRVGRTLHLPECNAFDAEALALRKAWAWSVPTERALEALGRHAPLLELGAGRGHWAGLLRERGVDICAVDTRRWRDDLAERLGMAADLDSCGRVGGPTAADAGAPDGTVDGGPEAVAERENAGRTLVLMWPDYAGRGSYGAACLRRYGGEVLVLVGEWADSTHGAALATDLPPHGQSFSRELQREVETRFALEERVELPNWPGCLDALMVWRRRPPQEVD